MYLKRPAGGLAFCLFYLASCFTNKVRAYAEPPQVQRGWERQRGCRGGGTREGGRSAGPREEEEEEEDGRSSLIALRAEGEPAGQAARGEEEGCPASGERPGLSARRRRSPRPRR